MLIKSPPPLSWGAASISNLSAHESAPRVPPSRSPDLSSSLHTPSSGWSNQPLLKKSFAQPCTRHFRGVEQVPGWRVRERLAWQEALEDASLDGLGDPLSRHAELSVLDGDVCQKGRAG
jgi:hypothetical protein